MKIPPHPQKAMTSPQPDPETQRETDNTEEFLKEPPANPLGGRTLVVDGKNPECFPRPSLALKEAGPNDQVFIHPGMYEDRIFVAQKPIHLIGAGRDHVQIFNRKSGPLYLQHVSQGQISGITFRYVGSDQHSAMNILDTVCTISQCRASEGLLSGIVIYGPKCRPTLLDNEVCHNRESGIFSFAGAQPYLTHNTCFSNHHFGMAVRDDGTSPDLVKNLCHDNMLSGILLFNQAKALLLENNCRDNHQWGLVMTPDCVPTPETDQLSQANAFSQNPRGAMVITHEPLLDIGR
ncbi:MAG: right-handed parallel beta-helix repeat-containing protein [Nitrospirota bacterium]|nr:right-handed parallel beta-helix repeat-containing protein [Nitrospirota bacterium]